MGKNNKGKGKIDFIFPDYRIWEDIPFGFWYVGFFAITLAFFNLSINFFSHFALLLGWLTDTVRDFPREPGGLDLALSGVFALYYLVGAPILFYLACLYWNFREGAKKRLKILFIVDAVVFVLQCSLQYPRDLFGPACKHTADPQKACCNCGLQGFRRSHVHHAR